MLTIEIPELARQRAAATATKLDDIQSDWFLVVDLDRLNMAWENLCVVGQLEGGGEWAYSDNNEKWANRLEPNSDREPTTIMHDAGLYCLHFLMVSRGEEFYDWGHLTAAWREEIIKRRMAAHN